MKYEEKRESYEDIILKLDLINFAKYVHLFIQWKKTDKEIKSQKTAQKSVGKEVKKEKLQKQ